MTALRSVESLAHGAKLFLFLLVTLAVGGALVGLGVGIAVPGTLDVGPLSGQAGTTTVAGGAVLALLGLFVAGAGLFGALSKLVADSVARGVEAGRAAAGGDDSAAHTGVEAGAGAASEATAGADSTAPAEFGGPAETAPASDDSGAATDDGSASGPAGDNTPTDAAAPVAEGDGAVTAEADPDSGPPGAVDGPPTGDDGGNGGKADTPRQPSPEEIAFGSTTDEGPDGADPDTTGDAAGGADGADTATDAGSPATPADPDGTTAPGDGAGDGDGGAEGEATTDPSEWFGDAPTTEEPTGGTEELADSDAEVEPAASSTSTDPLGDLDEE